MMPGGVRDQRKFKPSGGLEDRKKTAWSLVSKKVS